MPIQSDRAHSCTCKRSSCLVLKYRSNLQRIDAVYHDSDAVVLEEHEGALQVLVASTWAVHSILASMKQKVRRHEARYLSQSSSILHLRTHLRQLYGSHLCEQKRSVMILSGLTTICSAVDELSYKSHIVDRLNAECAQFADDLAELRGIFEGSRLGLRHCFDTAESLKLKVDRLAYEMKASIVRVQAHSQLLVAQSWSDATEIFMGERVIDVHIRLLPGALRAIGETLISCERAMLHRVSSSVRVQADRTLSEAVGSKKFDRLIAMLRAERLQHNTSEDLDVAALLLHQVHVDRSLELIISGLDLKVDCCLLDQTVELRYSEMLKYLRSALVACR